MDAARPSEHRPQREKMSKRLLGGIIGCKDRKTSSWHLTRFSDGNNIGRVSSIKISREKPTVILYTLTLIAMQGLQQSIDKRHDDELGLSSICYIGSRIIGWVSMKEISKSWMEDGEMIIIEN